MIVLVTTILNYSKRCVYTYSYQKDTEGEKHLNSNRNRINFWVNSMEEKQIIIMGVGNILFTDEGVGIRVLETLSKQYDFPPNVEMVDGRVLGMNLLGTISEADYLIVIDAVRNGGKPGTLYRLEGEEIPQRVLAKNSLHQVDLLEALTFCQALDKQPETLIIGVEPEDIKTVGLAFGYST